MAFSSEAADVADAIASSLGLRNEDRVLHRFRSPSRGHLVLQSFLIDLRVVCTGAGSVDTF